MSGVKKTREQIWHGALWLKVPQWAESSRSGTDNRRVLQEAVSPYRWCVSYYWGATEASAAAPLSDYCTSSWMLQIKQEPAWPSTDLHMKISGSRLSGFKYAKLLMLHVCVSAVWCQLKRVEVNLGQRLRAGKRLQLKTCGQTTANIRHNVSAYHSILMNHQG